MQGELSDNPFFKKFPKIMVYTYQLPAFNSSEELINIFNKFQSTYQKLKKNKTDEEIIHLILFNEIGLVNLSPNNLLKLFISELEYDRNEGDNHIALLVISNWIIDSAKINRGISIYFSKLDEEDKK